MDRAGPNGAESLDALFLPYSASQNTAVSPAGKCGDKPQEIHKQRSTLPLQVAYRVKYFNRYIVNFKAGVKL